MYCTPDEVVALTGTSLSTDELESLIALADEEIDALLEREGLSIGEGAPVAVQLASLFLSAALVLERQRTDCTLPDGMRVGEVQVSPKIEGQIAEYRARAEQLITSYISGQKGQDYYTAFARVQINWS